MITIPDQSSVPKACTEVEQDGRMKPGPLYDRVVDVMEELVKSTLLTRDCSDYLTDRYSERKSEGRPSAGKGPLAAIGVRVEAAE